MAVSRYSGTPSAKSYRVIPVAQKPGFPVVRDVENHFLALVGGQGRPCGVDGGLVADVFALEVAPGGDDVLAECCEV